MVRNLDPTTPRSFVAIAGDGGVTRAAAVPDLTQSALSQQIRRLAQMPGRELLRRSARIVALNGVVSGLMTLPQFDGDALNAVDDAAPIGFLALTSNHLQVACAILGMCLVHSANNNGRAGVWPPEQPFLPRERQLGANCNDSAAG